MLLTAPKAELFPIRDSTVHTAAPHHRLCVSPPHTVRGRTTHQPSQHPHLTVRRSRRSTFSSKHPFHHWPASSAHCPHCKRPFPAIHCWTILPPRCCYSTCFDRLRSWSNILTAYLFLRTPADLFCSFGDSDKQLKYSSDCSGPGDCFFLREQIQDFLLAFSF